jgi:hypothetical protein
VTTCVRAIQQPDGSLILALDPTVQDLSTCPYTVEDGSSNGWRELGNMSTDNAMEIGVAVGVVWAIAWGLRAVRMALETDDVKES